MEHLKKLGMRFLIVEDEYETRQTLAKLLQKLLPKIVIFHAKNLAEGIRISHKVKADITLLDPGLPDVSDYHIIGEAIKNGLFYPPVIITTGFPDYDKSREIYYMKCGAQQVFHKPYVEQVVALIASASAGAAMRELVKKNNES